MLRTKGKNSDCEQRGMGLSRRNKASGDVALSHGGKVGKWGGGELGRWGGGEVCQGTCHCGFPGLALFYFVLIEISIE